MKAGLLVSASLLFLGCDDSFSPGELAGSYQLTTIDGNPPPYLELATIECDQSIISGVLVLDASGTHAMNLTIALDCPRGGGQVTLQARDYLGTFSVDDDKLEFSSVLQPDGANLNFEGHAEEGAVEVDLPSATIQGLMLEMRFEE